MAAKILVVEDEQAMLMGLKDNLEFEGYEVDTAEVDCRCQGTWNIR